ncbi:MAG TPA: prepilin-type N-terminal cleavage/methylation domain-containing protein [Candidatus Paceibacterota bacterium]|nr:prepilin-type N-terminal cleavage/methylation domain-containing protein [Candidatus Paceibacterota bacterium]
MKISTRKGFTLIELLVVIAIIGILSSVVLASLSSARRKAKEARIISDMEQIKIALELYNDANGFYPTGGYAGVETRTECTSYGGLANNAVIPGLVPNYLPRFPVQPITNGTTACYIYRVDQFGTGYAILAHRMRDVDSNFNYTSHPELIDPYRDGGVSSTTVDYTDPAGIWAWKMSTANAIDW